MIPIFIHRNAEKDYGFHRAPISISLSQFGISQFKMLKVGQKGIPGCSVSE